MASNRWVPWTWAVISGAIGVWLIIAFVGWWKYIPSGILFAFAWASIKTATGASEKEIAELTGDRPVSDETKRGFQDRL